MGFKREEVSELLVAVHRRCSICHRFCGTKIETDHIIPEADKGTDEIDNAIPVCFECHAEIHSYNDQHPRGRKFTPDELHGHKAQWLRICEQSPDALLAPSRAAGVGPLQALIDELEFNLVVCGGCGNRGALFGDEQFRRAIARGAIAILTPTLKDAILQAYAATSRANQRILAEINYDPDGAVLLRVTNAAISAIRDGTPKVTKARDLLLTFLGSEEPAGAADVPDVR